MLLSGSFNPNLRIGYWRTDEEPMQIVSGHHGKWIVHYEAPPSQDVPKEMKRFILGLITLLLANPKQLNLRRYVLRLHICILRVFIHLTMAMAELAEQLLKKLCRKVLVILHVKLISGH